MPIRKEMDRACALIVIDRPERRNAINHGMLEELHELVGEAVDSGARSIILSGTGGHFCAGADLTELEDIAFTERLREVLDRIAEAPVPVFASISGACMGLGMQLALASDVIVATPDAYFGVPVAKLGLMVDHWTLRRLVSTMGAGTARLMTMTAETIDFDVAAARGFIQVEGDHDVALALAHRVETLAPLSLSGTKLGLNLVESSSDGEDYREAFRTAWESADLVEGRLAFAERRPPEFKGS